jgi:hypothetical protein
LQPPLAYNAARASVLIEENESIYIPQAGPYGSVPQLELPWLWRQENAGLRIAAWLLLCLVVVSLTAALAPTLRRHWRLATSKPALWLAGGVLLTLGPTLADVACYLRSDQHSFQYGRLDRQGTTYTGLLWAPLRGRYIFLNDAQDPITLRLEGTMYMENQTGDVVNLEPGLKKIQIQGVEGQPGVLRWTIPGGAQYKQPVPRVNLYPSKLTSMDRLRLFWEQWKWLAITGYTLLAVANLTTRTPDQSIPN